MNKPQITNNSSSN